MKRLLVLCSMLALAACAPPPPAPTPAPPPPPMAAAHVYTVYFGWDRAWVGPVGIKILRQAADVYKAGGAVHVQITGFTDTSGKPAFNDKLSRLRAQHVAHILARMGVPWKAMTVSGEGEKMLAVPTPDGVRDARNRRVTIVE